ncbi:hypothetical protein MVEN_01787400 [Mycena venus]|uniref:Uncharacterized protein n=1 Tax=Mycena venus TaxID=2733690 RepID=A0A8H6XI81_9AGAR|nr:hypothetical protein MVEN_01787400 [Mycena venus]
MPTVPEDSISAATSAFPTKALVVVFAINAIALTVHFTSPLRLITVLTACIDEAVDIYIEAHGLGLISTADTKTLHNLQLEVSAIVEQTLRNSFSWSAILRDFFQGRSFTLLRCILDVKRFETHIKILKESQLRTEGTLHPRAILLRRRGLCSRSGGDQSQCRA